VPDILQSADNRKSVASYIGLIRANSTSIVIEY